MTAARDRVERERQFHDALIREGHTTIATKEWWETPGGRVRFERRIALLKAVCITLKAPPLNDPGCSSLVVAMVSG